VSQTFRLTAQELADIIGAHVIRANRDSLPPCRLPTRTMLAHVFRADCVAAIVEVTPADDTDTPRGGGAG